MGVMRLKTTPPEPTDLFRQEAIDGRRLRQSGETLISSPLMTLPATLGIIAIVITAVVVSLLLPFSREFRANGWIVPEAGLVEVRSPTSGSISAIYLAEGASVRMGDRLVAIDTDSRLEQGGRVQDALMGASRGSAELLDGRERTIVTAHEASTRADRDRLESLMRDRAQLSRMLELKRRNAAARTAQLARYNQLVERGFGSVLEQQRRQSEQLSAEQEVIEGEVRLSSLNRDIAELQNRMVQERSTFSLALNEIRQQRVGVSTELLQANARRGVSVTAPSSGFISRLTVRVGQSVNSASPLLSIVPPGRLEIQLLAPAQSSGLPQPGALVRVMVDAFPYRRFGALTGRVRSVARSTTLPDDATRSIGVREPYFVIAVALDPQQAGPISRVDLRPGMSVSARVELEQRSPLSWLLPQS